MRGTRYGDFSRLTDVRGYSGVLMQQGRVQLDADVNEQSAGAAHALRQAVSDLFGGSAAPAVSPGFGLRPRVALSFESTDRLLLDEADALALGPLDEHTFELWLSWERPGVIAEGYTAGGGYSYRIAVDGHGLLSLTHSGRVQTASAPVQAGVPVHLALVVGLRSAALYLDGLRFVRSDDWPERVDVPFILLGRPLEGDAAGFTGLVSGARAWSRARTAAELVGAAEPLLLEEAGLLAVWPFDECRGGELTDAVGGRTLRFDGDVTPRWRLTDLIIEPGRFYVDGVLCELAHRGLYSRQPGRRPPLPASGRHLAYLEVWEEAVSAVADPALREVALGGLDTTVRTRVAARVRVAPADSPPGEPTSARLVAEHRGHYAPGNHLYRVEIHRGGDAEATFKWSRDNGSSLFAVVAVERSPHAVEVQPAIGAVQPLAPGDVVEPLGPEAALDDEPQRLLRVEEVYEHEGLVLLDAAPPSGTAFLRRWDHDASPDAESWTDAPHPESAELPVRSDWIELEEGIRIRFEGDEYRRGDYWWIVSRLDLRSIEWPHEHGHPLALPPNGVERVIAPLATITLEDDEVAIEDVRRIVTAAVVERPAEPAPPEPEQEPPFEPSDPEPTPEPPPPPLPPRPHWHLLHTVELAGLEIEHAISEGERILAATAHELFAVASGEAHRLAELPVVRHGFSLCVLGSVLLLAGGGEKPEHADGHVHALDLHHGHWSKRRELPHHRTEVAVVAHHGHAHAIAGRHRALLRHGVAGSHHIYDPHHDKWREARELPTHRAGAAAVAVGRHIHVIGGHGDAHGHEPHTAHERYDTQSETWEKASPLPHAKAVAGGCAHGEHPLVLHDDGTALSYDDGWIAQPDLPESLARPFLFSHEGRAHMLGTREDGTVAHYALHD